MLEVQTAPLPHFEDDGYYKKKMADVLSTTAPFDSAAEKKWIDFQSPKNDLVGSTETLKEKVTELPSTKTHDAASIQDMEAAKAAAAFIMNIPEVVVQLVIDAQRLHLDPSLAFTDSQQLAQAALAVSCSPQRQAQLAMEIYQAQKDHKKQLEAGESTGPAVKAAAGDDGDHAGVSDCQKHLAGMSEARQSAAACQTSSSSSTSSSSTSSSSTSSSSPTSSQTPAKQDGCGHHHQQSAGQQGVTSASLSPHSKIISGQTESQPTPAAEMLQGHAKTSTTSTASTNADVTTATPNPRQELRQKLRVLAAENRKLKNRKLCRACLKVDLAESGITFLPCGHFITCESCSEMFDDCPACGKNIMGTVRTFLS